ncbi:MAG: ABC transporter ATP-binding protein [Acidimicrobiales bacterium]|nr:ABC transporter ATP-binding protein [Acidimicrobiales bacterium]
MTAGNGIPAVELENVTKRFADFTAVDSLNLNIGENTFFAMLGPSGCGKTTTLRMIGGFEDPTSGTIRLHGDDVTGLKPYRRAVNTVFQSYALFPHMTVAENVAFGLRRKKVDDAEVKRRVGETLELVQLSARGSAKPRQLSGGQQQRVALARALINHPRVLLLDEPLGALDLKLRKEMQIELKRIQQEVGITFIHVTHDQEEAMTMADTIAVMNQGRIERLGSPSEIYEDPRTPFVAGFLGASNLMSGTVSGNEVGLPNGAVIRLTDIQAARCNGHNEVQIGVRPEKLSFFGSNDGNAPVNRLSGVIADTSFTGTSTQYLVEVPGIGQVAVVEQNLGDIHDPGEEVTVAWKPEHTFVVE